MTQHIYIVKSKKNPDFLELFYSKIFADNYINFFKEADPTLYSQTKPVLESQTNDKLYYVYKSEICKQDNHKAIGKITAIKFLKNYYIKSYTTDDAMLDDFLKNKKVITEKEIEAHKIKLIDNNSINNTH